MLKRAYRYIAMLLILVIALTACGGNGSSGANSSLIGRWREDGQDRSDFEFNSDGTATEICLNSGLTNDEYVWSIDGNFLTIDSTYGDEERIFSFKISGDTLTVELDGEASTFTRVQ